MHFYLLDPYAKYTRYIILSLPVSEQLLSSCLHQKDLALIHVLLTSMLNENLSRITM